MFSRFSLIFFFLSTTLAIARADDDSSVFGRSNQGDAALIGVLYDTKQTMNHVPTNIGGGDGYTAIIDEFITKHWDEAVLNRYYRVSKPLYTTQIFVPQMTADNGPKAFGAEKYVKPSAWLIHYKAQVSPPSDGTYRFWGSGDDIFVVGLDGKLVLVANHPGSPLKVNLWKSSEPMGANAGDSPLRAGDWMDLKADQIYDLDIIIGEKPGGYFNAFCLMQKQGETYAKDKDGNLILPIFQVAPFDTPVHPPSANDEPPFAKGYPTWKSFQ